MTTETDLIIRNATPEDRQVIAALQTASWRSAYAEFMPAAYLETEVEGDMTRHWASVEMKPSDVVLIAEKEGVAIGFITVWCRPTPFIDNLHVLPGHKSQGVGRALMREAAIRLIDQNHASVYLWVLPGNAPAKNFYLRLGGEVTEAKDKAAFGNVLLQEKIAWTDLSLILEAAARTRA